MVIAPQLRQCNKSVSHRSPFIIGLPPSTSHPFRCMYIYSFGSLKACIYYCRSGSRESVYFISCLLATFVSVAGNKYVYKLHHRLRLIASRCALLLLTLRSPTQVYTTTYRRQVYTCSKEQHAHRKNAYVLYTRTVSYNRQLCITWPCVSCCL